MGLLSFFKTKKQKKASPMNYYRDLLHDLSPIFSAFGNDVYCSDIIRSAVALIARETGKLTLRAIQEKEFETNGTSHSSIRKIKDGMNKLFMYRPNEWMTPRALLEWIGWTLATNDNAFLFPDFYEVKIGNGLVKREYTAIYGITAETVGVDYAEDGTPMIGFASNGKAWVLPYHDVIHIRKTFGENAFFGGRGVFRFSSEDTLRSLRTMTAVEGGIEKAIKASLEVHGIMEMVGANDIEKRQLKLTGIEDHVEQSKYGFLVTDFESNFKPFSIPMPNIPTETLDWIEQKVLAPYGVSLSILRGDDAKYSAFFANTIEPIKTEIEQAFTACLFTEKEVVTFGKSIKAYDKLLKNIAIEKRMEYLKVLHGTGVLSNDEERSLAGFEPNGEPTFISLNYAEKNLISAYQMARAKLDSKENKGEEDESRTE